MRYDEINIGDIFSSPSAWDGAKLSYRVIRKKEDLIEVMPSYPHPSLPKTIMPNGKTVREYLENMPLEEFFTRMKSLVNARKKVEKDLSSPLSSGRTMLDIEIIEGKPSTLTFLKNVIDEQIELMEQVKNGRKL